MNAYRFCIPLSSPLVLKGQSHTQREGVLIERDGRWAEASPLPGFSQESIGDVVAALRGERQPPASLRFAINSLENSVVFPRSVPWNYLLLGNREQVLDGVEKCSAASCKAVKLKVGREEVSTEVDLVREVRTKLPQHVSLRLDANQAWSLEQATEFAQAVAGLEIEYVEEPLKNSGELETLFSRTGLLYALDETLLQNDDLSGWPNAAALVCKPTILGGRNVIERLASAGKPIVFSAAFESGVGVAKIVQLAAEFSPDVPAGLDTLDWLSDDLLESPLRKQGGMFVVDGEPQVNAAKLERIEI